MKKALAILSCMVACAGVPAVTATTLTNWGTMATVAVGDCGGPCDDIGVLNALLIDPGAQFSVDSMPNALMASTALVTPLGNAQATATAALLDGVTMPELTVATSAIGTGFTSATAIGIQGYDYIGTGETIDVNVSLTGTVTANGAGLHTELGAFVYLFTTTQLANFINDPGSVDSAFGLSGIFLQSDTVAALPDNPPLNQANPFGQQSNGPVSLQGTLSIDVGDGSVTPEQFYLAAILYGFADSDGDAVESLNTLSLAFDPEVDTSLLVEAAAIPLPAAVWLFLPALAVVRRRRLPG